MANKIIDVLPDKDEVYTMEESDLMNSMNGYGRLLHILGSSFERKVPENENFPKVKNKGNTEDTGQDSENDKGKTIAIWIVCILIAIALISLWDALPAHIQVLPGLWFNK